MKFSEISIGQRVEVINRLSSHGEAGTVVALETMKMASGTLRRVHVHLSRGLVKFAAEELEPFPHTNHQ